MAEVSDKTLEAWFRPRCRCELCGVVATLGDLETCECGSHIWRHDCPETGESYTEHSIEFHRDQLQAELTRLREGLERIATEVSEWEISGEVSVGLETRAKLVSDLIRLATHGGIE